MSTIITFAGLMYIVQLAHSIEELSTGFHKKWFLFKMSFSVFFAFEVLHNFFWLLVLTQVKFPYRIELLALFIILMFVNGLEHIIWAAVVKKYIPGLISAPIHVVLFLMFCFQLIFLVNRKHL